MHYDLCLGNEHQVLLTLTDEDAAIRLAKAVDEEREHLFQAEDLDVFVQEVNRGPMSGGAAVTYVAGMTASDIWKTNVEDLEPIIADQDDPTAVRQMLGVEKSNPSHQGGRKGVVDACQERLGELATGDE